MNNEILIGEKMPHTLWGKYCWEDSIVVQNQDEKYYYISIGIFGLDKHIYGNSKYIIIMSGTPEYEELTELIKTKDNNIIEKYAQILTIKYSSPEYTYSMIEKVKQEKYNQGVRDTQSKLLDVLGIKRGENTPYLIRI